jgi:phage recombination protein Bet
MTAAAQPQSLVISTARELGMSDSYLQLVKDVYAKNATDEELALFLRTAHRTGLDPAARQIYLVKRWDSSLKREVASPQVSIDGFRLIADRTDKYVPGREATFEYDSGSLHAATAYIKKFAGGEWHEISATAFFNEYVQKNKEGKPTSMWIKMPHLMLAKCAEALVLRKAFPAELSGLYSPEEMGQAANGDSHSSAVVKSATDVVVAEVIDAEPVNEPNEFLDLKSRVATLCKDLKTAGDTFKWSKENFAQYAADLCSLDAANIDLLTIEQWHFIVEDLEQRLDSLR